MTNETENKTQSAGCLSTGIMLWSITAIVLNLCGIGKFAEWDITAWPWHWSCLCVFYWYAIIVAAICIIACTVLLFLKNK